MMLMNGLKMKRLKQESISKMTTKSGLSKVGVLIVFLFLSGCGDRGWTNIQYENRSDEPLRVIIKGVSPDQSMSSVPAGAGKGELSRVARNFSQPLYFEDTITITWRAKKGGNERSQELKRSDFKIPATVRGGKIRFIYSAEGKWSIKYK